MADNLTQVESSMVMGCELKKAYDLTYEELERLLWDCEATLQFFPLNVNIQLSSNIFTQNGDIRNIVASAVTKNGSYFFKDDIARGILKEAGRITGKTYTIKKHNEITKTYKEIVVDTSIVDLEKAVLWLMEKKFPLLREAKGILKHEVEEIISISTQQREKCEEIKKWQTILKTLTGRSRTLVLINIAKLEGKSHVQAYDSVFPAKKDTIFPKSKATYVLKAKQEIMELAAKVGLNPPAWCFK